MRWLVLGLLLPVIATAPVNAQAPIYCAVEFTKGDIWLDHYQLEVRNIGTGVAYGVQINTSFLATVPGATAPVLRTEPVTLIQRLGPGVTETLKLDWNQIGDTFSASVAACQAQ